MLDELDPLTRLMLINALLYKAPWRDKWELAEGREFRGESTKTRKDYLHAEKDFGYADCGDFEAVRLPYGNTAYEMVAILPKEGKTVGDILPAVAEKLDGLTLAERPAEVFLPRFSTESCTTSAVPSPPREPWTAPPITALSTSSRPFAYPIGNAVRMETLSPLSDGGLCDAVTMMDPSYPSSAVKK